MMRFAKRHCLLSVGLLALYGCTSNYVIVEPVAVSSTIEQATDRRFVHDGVDYVVREVDGQLVFRVVNTTDAPIHLLPGSRVIDPAGVAHVIDKRVIEPNQSLKIELPPRVSLPDNERIARSMSEATVGSVDGPVYRGDNRQQPQLRRPGEGKPQPRWSWSNNGLVRVALRLRVGESEKSHLFVFRKETR